MSQTEQYIEDTRQWLREHNDAYKTALEKLGDHKFVRRLFSQLEANLEPVLSYNAIEHAPHVAVFACGAVQAKVEALLTDFEFVDEYEHQLEEVRRVESEYAASTSGQGNPAETPGSRL